MFCYNTSLERERERERVVKELRNQINQVELEMEWWWRLYWGLVVIIMMEGGGHAEGGEVTYDGRSLIIDGKRQMLFSGSIHYPRSTPEVII